MEIIFAALAEAILSVLIEDLAQQPLVAGLRNRLRGPSQEELALSRALGNAYADFARTHPRVTEAFFDETFLLQKPVVAELSKALKLGAKPSSEVLGVLWRAQFHQAPDVDLVTEICFFLDTLEGHIKSEASLRPFVDSRAFQQLYPINTGIAQLVAQVEEIRAQEREILVSEQAILGVLPTVIRSLANLLPTRDEPPLPPSLFAEREELLSEVDDRLKRVTWLALVGGPGIGKTQLARSYQALGRRPSSWWISLGSDEPRQDEAHFEQQLQCWLDHIVAGHTGKLFEAIRPLSLSALAREIAARVPGPALLVIDDLPDPPLSPRIYAALMTLALIFARSSVRLISTSLRSLPFDLETALGDAVAVLQPPPFADKDVQDILARAGAPAQLIDEKTVALLVATTNGHPSLVSATVMWWRQRSWRFDSGTQDALLFGDPGQRPRLEARRAIARLIDEPCRELLYRASLLGTEFPKALLQDVTTVQPAITRMRECVDELSGIWLEERSPGVYSLSPLLKDAGIENLEDEVRKGIHTRAARWYVSAGKVTPEQAVHIAGHLHAAGLHSEMVQFLVQFMLSAHTAAEARYIDWTTGVFLSPGSWPRDLSRDLKIFLRAVQVRTMILAGSNPQKLNAELDALIAEAEPSDGLAVLFAAMTSGPLLDGQVPLVQLRRAHLAARLLNEQPDLVPEGLPDVPVVNVLWIAAARLDRVQDITEFFGLVEHLPREQQEALFTSELAIEGGSLLLDRLWDVESRHGQEENWPSILSILDRVRELAQRTSSPSLLAAVIRSRAIVLSDFLQQRDVAVREIEEMRPTLTGDNLRLLDYTIGCILAADRQYERALPYLIEAAQPSPYFLLHRVEALRRLAVTRAYFAGNVEAFNLTATAFRLLRGMPGSLDFDRVDLLGALAWTLWSLGKRKRAVATIMGGVSILVRKWDPTDARLRETYNKVMHSLGWYNTSAASGSPPPQTASGEPYISPDVEFYLVRRPRMADFTSPAGFSTAVMLSQLASLASHTGLPRIALKLFDFSLDEVRETDPAPILLSSYVEHSPLAARFGRFDRALVLGIEGAKGLTVFPQLTGASSLWIPVQNAKSLIESAWSSLLPEEREKGERLLLQLVFAPAFLGLIAGVTDESTALAELRRWRGVVKEELKDEQKLDFWLATVSFLEQLLESWYNNADKRPVVVPGDNVVLKALHYVVASTHRSMLLLDSLRAQAYALDHFLTTPHIGRHSLPDMGVVFRRFWMNIARTRRFAIRHPDLTHELLLKVPLEENARTAVQTLRIAARALGVTLPPEIDDRFTNAVNQPGR